MLGDGKAPDRGSRSLAFRAGSTVRTHGTTVLVLPSFSNPRLINTRGQVYFGRTAGAQVRPHHGLRSGRGRAMPRTLSSRQAQRSQNPRACSSCPSGSTATCIALERTNTTGLCLFVRGLNSLRAGRYTFREADPDPIILYSVSIPQQLLLLH